MSKFSENILVIKLSALGDFIQALGPMRAIREAHKGAHITLLTTKPFKSFGEESAYANEVIVDKRPRWFQLQDWLSLRAALNQKPYAHVYDLQNNSRAKIYKKLITGDFQWHSILNQEERKEHALTRHKKILGRAGVEDYSFDKLEWAGKNTDINSLGISKPYALLVPGCAPQHPYKRWPAEYYGEIANHFEGQGITPVILGTKAEEEEAQTIQNICPKAVSLIGKTSLFDIPALARDAVLAIGNDTGPMHMIGPTGCPSLVLFSYASDPLKHKPIGEHVDTLKEENLSDLRPSAITEHIQPWLTEIKSA